LGKEKYDVDLVDEATPAADDRQATDKDDEGLPLASDNECYNYYREDEEDNRKATPPPALHGQDEEERKLATADGC
jgi:hypothetical protein